MATTAVAQRRESRVKESTYLWEGIDRSNRNIRGEAKAASETVVRSNLRRQGIRITKLKRQTFRGGGRVSEKDITFFTRQLATMLRAGVPLLQAFEIVARGHKNPRFARLMMDIKSRVESGSSLPAPTLIVIAISDFFVSYWWLMAAIIAGALFTFFFLLRRSEAFRYAVDRISLKLPIIGAIVEKATIARWTRTLSTMFAAGV